MPEITEAVNVRNDMVRRAREAVLDCTGRSMEGDDQTFAEVVKDSLEREDLLISLSDVLDIDISTDDFTAKYFNINKIVDHALAHRNQNLLTVEVLANLPGDIEEVWSVRCTLMGLGPTLASLLPENYTSAVLTIVRPLKTE